MRRLLSINDLLKQVPFGRSKLYELVQSGAFPKPVKISPGRSAWLETEVDAWIGERIALRDGGEAK